MNEKNIIYGLHAVEALLAKHPDKIIQLSLLQDRSDLKIQKLIELAKSHDKSVSATVRQLLTLRLPR